MNDLTLDEGADFAHERTQGVVVEHVLYEGVPHANARDEQVCYGQVHQVIVQGRLQVGTPEDHEHDDRVPNNREHEQQS